MIMENSNLFSLKGKTIAITGSTGGLGSIMTEHLAAAGADLALIDIDQSAEKLEKNKNELKKQYGTQVFIYIMNSSDETNIKDTAQQIVKDFGHLDGLFNMAGINQHGTVNDHSEADIMRLLQVNVAGTYACCKHFGKIMCEQHHGSILNIASIAGINILHTELTMSGYSISKAGVIQLTKAFAGEFGAFNVRVNCISPGYMQSRMSGTKGAHPINTEKFNCFIKEATPMQRSIRADELCGAAIYFLSDASTATTGVNLPIDGGFLIW